MFNALLLYKAAAVAQMQSRALPVCALMLTSTVLLQIAQPLSPVQTNAWDRTLADWLRRGDEATRDYQAVRLNEIDMENGLYRYRVNSVLGSKYALTDDEVVSPQDDLGAQVRFPLS